MAVLLFFIVLSALVLVHELGHFLVAKLCKVSVYEFGFGFPPKIAKLFRWKETVFTLNALPFGGFVKMEGEDTAVTSPNSFGTKHPAQKLLILIAGIVGNLLFAWLLIIAVFSIGAPVSSELATKYNITGLAQTTVLEVTTDSAAAQAGIVPGTVITNFTPEELHTAVITSNGSAVTLQTISNDTETAYVLQPQYDSVEQIYKVGIASDSIVHARVSIVKAIHVGFVMTAGMTKNVAIGFAGLIADVFKGHPDTTSITGPIGLIGIVGAASKTGIIHLLMLTALISVNLAVLNILPLPALDGGRIFVTIIEWIRGKQFNQNILGKVHTIGFILLLAILVAVTIKDIRGLF